MLHDRPKYLNVAAIYRNIIWEFRGTIQEQKATRVCCGWRPHHLLKIYFLKTHHSAPNFSVFTYNTFVGHFCVIGKSWFSKNPQFFVVVQNMKINILHRNASWVWEISFRAHFKDHFILIYDKIGTIPLTWLVYGLQGEVAIT